MPCFRAVCNRKCASCGNICALRGAAMRGMLTADREIPPPPERMSWPRPVSGSFFMAGFTGHKKRPDPIRGGLAPLSAPAALCPFPCRIFSMGETKQFCPVTPVIKRRISFEAGFAPSSAPSALCPFPYRIFRSVEPKQFCPVAPAIKKARSHSRRVLPPRAPPHSISSCRVLTTDGKKSTLPRQSALRLGCSILAGWCRIRQPSSPWPALRVPCCPRRRGQWQG